MPLGPRIDLLTDDTATGDWKVWPGGRLGWVVWATAWGGATATLQMSPDQGTTAINVDDSAMTANGGGSFDLPGGIYIRVAVTVASPTGMSSFVSAVD